MLALHFLRSNPAPKVSKSDNLAWIRKLQGLRGLPKERFKHELVFKGNGGAKMIPGSRAGEEPRSDQQREAGAPKPARSALRPGLPGGFRSQVGAQSLPEIPSERGRRKHTRFSPPHSPVFD